MNSGDTQNRSGANFRFADITPSEVTHMTNLSQSDSYLWSPKKADSLKPESRPTTFFGVGLNVS